MPEASEPRGSEECPPEPEIPDPSAIRPWPADRVERWPIERVIPYTSNPRVHSEADLDKIAASIRKWGWTAPPVVDEAGVLIVGTARVAAAAKIGLTTIPVIIARGWERRGKKRLSHRRQSIGGAGELGPRSVTQRTPGARLC